MASVNNVYASLSENCKIWLDTREAKTRSVRHLVGNLDANQLILDEREAGMPLGVDNRLVTSGPIVRLMTPCMTVSERALTS